MILFGGGVQTSHGRILDLVDFRKGSQVPASKMTIGTIEQKVTIDISRSGKGDWDDIGRGPLHWLKYKQ